MNKLNVFISSTCYDLQLIRSDLRSFLEGIGYNPIMSDYGDVVYDPRKSTHESCLEASGQADVLVLIIGGRHGGVAIPKIYSQLKISSLKKMSRKKDFAEKDFKISITQAEALHAIQNKIPVYTFIAANVLNDHLIYESNKPNKIIYPSIQKQETAEYIFEFINFIRTRTNANCIFSFDNPASIKSNLTNQLGGFFAKLLRDLRHKDNANNNAKKKISKTFSI